MQCSWTIQVLSRGQLLFTNLPVALIHLIDELASRYLYDGTQIVTPLLTIMLYSSLKWTNNTNFNKLQSKLLFSLRHVAIPPWVISKEHLSLPKALWGHFKPYSCLCSNFFVWQSYLQLLFCAFIPFTLISGLCEVMIPSFLPKTALITSFPHRKQWVKITYQFLKKISLIPKFRFEQETVAQTISIIEAHTVCLVLWLVFIRWLELASFKNVAIASFCSTTIISPMSRSNSYFDWYICHSAYITVTCQSLHCFKFSAYSHSFLSLSPVQHIN